MWSSSNHRHNHHHDVGDDHRLSSRLDSEPQQQGEAPKHHLFFESAWEIVLGVTHGSKLTTIKSNTTPCKKNKSPNVHDYICGRHWQSQTRSLGSDVFDVKVAFCCWQWEGVLGPSKSDGLVFAGLCLVRGGIGRFLFLVRLGVLRFSERTKC